MKTPKNFRRGEAVLGFLIVVGCMWVVGAVAGGIIANGGP